MNRTLPTILIAALPCLFSLGCLAGAPDEIDQDIAIEDELLEETEQAATTYTCVTAPLFTEQSSLKSSDFDGHTLELFSPPPSDPSYSPEDFVLDIGDVASTLHLSAFASFAGSTPTTEAACKNTNLHAAVYGFHKEKHCWVEVMSRHTRPGVWTPATKQKPAGCSVEMAAQVPQEMMIVRIAGQAEEHVQGFTTGSGRPVSLGLTVTQ